jgi:predicted flap endonuclease-1-like 5' DNA nuclease
LAAVIGALTFLVMLGVTERSFFGAVLYGLVVGAGLGVLFKWLFCPGASGPATASDAAAGSAPSSDSGAGAAMAGAGSATSTGAAWAATAVAAGTAVAGDGAAHASGAGAASGDDAKTETAAAPGESAVAAQSDRKPDDPEANPGAHGASAATTPEPQAAPETPEPAPGAAGTSAAEARPVSAEAEITPADSADAATTPAGGSEVEAQPAGSAPAPGHDRPAVTPSKPLAGQADLAARRGSWRYEPPEKPASAAAERSEATPEAAPTKPLVLEAARPEGPDNLQEIKGIGPALETLCHDLGIWHFDQIAAWTPAEVAWMDANLEGFRGRVSRDDWVRQAQALAARGG